MSSKPPIKINTVGDLRKAVAEMAHIPDETAIHHQVVAKNGDAWWMRLSIGRMFNTYDKPVITMSHDELEKLPKETS